MIDFFELLVFYFQGHVVKKYQNGRFFIPTQFHHQHFEILTLFLIHPELFITKQIRLSLQLMVHILQILDERALIQVFHVFYLRCPQHFTLLNIVNFTLRLQWNLVYQRVRVFTMHHLVEELLTVYNLRGNTDKFGLNPTIGEFVKNLLRTLAIHFCSALLLHNMLANKVVNVLIVFCFHVFEDSFNGVT